MQKVFEEVNTLDRRCYKQYGLSEDLLMEHASMAMLQFIEKKCDKNSSVLIVCGLGNNGADGIALGRMLQSFCNLTLFLPFGVKSEMGKLQLERSELVNLDISISYEVLNQEYDVVVDCLFGTGLNKELDETSIKIIEKLNNINAYKIACDIPSGINTKGQIEKNAFIANTTITMGALKESLYTDVAKDYVGIIEIANLGLQRFFYESDSDVFLLDKDDMKLPYKVFLNTHKGDYGHLSVYVGEKLGAGLIACQSAFSFGVGLVTAITSNQNIPIHIMNSTTLPPNTTAIAIGMGLGIFESKTSLLNDLAKIVDADMFYDNFILELLTQNKIVLTPHPKEFCSLLTICNLAFVTVEELQKDRFRYVKLFSEKYPHVVLLLKGANSLIGFDNKIYINNLGSSKLSFGGSGDVLSGLIGSLLAQGYDILNATISGSLAHSLAALNYTYSNYSLTPEGLIEQIKKL